MNSTDFCPKPPAVTKAAAWVTSLPVENTPLFVAANSTVVPLSFRCGIVRSLAMQTVRIAIPLSANAAGAALNLSR